MGADETRQTTWQAWKSRAVDAVVGPTLWSRVVAVVVALLLTVPVLLWAGSNPIDAYSAMFSGALGTWRGFGDVLVRADTFVLLGLGIAICVRAGFFNVGAEGQLWLGALGSTVVALYWDGPGPLVIVAALIAGFVFGALWSVLVAVLKITLRVDELIGSLMLNYVAILLVGYLTFGPMQAYRAGQTERIPDAAFLPTLFSGTRVHAGVLLAAAAVIIFWLIMRRTTFGYEIATVGGNAKAARFAGIDVNRVYLKVSLIGGGLCGLAGANTILGVQHVLLSNLSPGWGYTAIAVALLGGLSAVGVLLASLLFGILEIGATSMQYKAGVPASVGGFVEGLILVVFLLSIPVHRVLRGRRQRDRAAEGEGDV